MSSEDEFGDDLAWDDATLEALASFDASTPAQQRAKPAPAPPPPRASQVPPQRRAQPPPNPPPQHRRAPLLPPHPPPPGPSQLAPGGTQGGAGFPGSTQQQQYLGPAPKTGILRPPKPPQRSTQSAAPAPPPPQPRAAAPALAAAPAPAPAPKRHPRQSLNAAGEPGFVDPNPFAGRPAAAPPAPLAPPAAPRARSRTPAVVKAEPDAAHGLEQGHSGGGRGAVRHDDRDEDLPAIAFDEHGGGGYKAEPQRGTTVVAPGARGGARAAPPAHVQAQAQAHAAVIAHQGGAPVTLAPAAAVEDAERRELERLRAEKDQLAQQLALAKKTQQDLERQVMTKTGENSVVRQRLTKMETAHQVALKAEQRDKALLQEQLEQREREYRTQLERFKMEDAFRRQELATAGISGLGSASSQRTYGASSAHPNHPGLSSARSARFYGRAGSAAPSPGPAAGPAPSPSVDRAGGSSAARRRSARTASAAPAPAPAPVPSFAGFQSAFGPSTTKGAAGGGRQKDKEGAADQQEGDKEEREGSMGPPRKRAPRTPGGPLESKRRKGEGATGKGKGRLMLVEEDAFGGGAADETDLGGYEHAEALMPDGEADMGDEEDGEAWVWVPEDRDARSELLAAVFSHTTLAPLDVEPAVVPPSAHPPSHPHSMRRATATGTTATATATSSSRFGTSTRSTASTYAGRFPSIHSALYAHSSSTSPTPSGPVPTFHALMNLRFPSTTPAPLVAEYEVLTRELFTLLGRRLDPHGHPSSSYAHPSASTSAAQFALLPPHLALSTRPEDLETALLASDLTRALTRLLGVLERATLVGPMTALLRLLSHLVFLFPHVAHSCCAAATATAAPGASATAAAAMGSDVKGEPLTQLLARIVARYARPETPTKEHAGGSAAAAAALLARGAGGGVMLRSRKARIARPSTVGSGAGKRRGGRDGADPDKEGEERVPLEAGKRARLFEGVLGVLEGVAWRCLAVRKADEASGEGDGGRAAEEAFIAFLKAANAVATLLDPNQSIGVLLGGTRLLALLACRPALFRTLLAVKFYELPDIRASKLPLVDRLATLLVLPRAESLAAHTLDRTILSLASLLLTAHEDAVMLVAQAASFVPELLAKMWRDVRTLWEWDGREATKGSAARDMLNRTTTRLSATMHLLYYLSLVPHSSLSSSDLLAGPTSATATAAGAGAAGSSKDHLAGGPAPAYARQAVNDLFMVALGTVGFATFGAEEGSGQGNDKEDEGEGGMPSWAEEGSKQRRVLCELGYLAQEILEDVSPLELEEIEVCFAPPGDSDGEDGDERMADGEDDGEDERQLAGAEEGV
ncbi:hypothetical protein JCM9279_002040 [Rhodotorula babjevae]